MAANNLKYIFLGRIKLDKILDSFICFKVQIRLELSVIKVCAARVGCTLSKNRSFGFYAKCNGESDSAIFSHFRSSLATRNWEWKKVALPLKSKYFFQRMFGLWYLKEAYSKYRNNVPKILKIRVMVTEQFMKMF